MPVEYEDTKSVTEEEEAWFEEAALTHDELVRLTRPRAA